ncbi:hypothetical protein [Mumia sp. zg.B21]|uniref:hypothetical protein n=1 Tax=Mumia sp. zg.B21 TaxID=2855447 RepID=UPI0021042F51|nr:hypothetical protein [Mumia sp. zg.B21]
MREDEDRLSIVAVVDVDRVAPLAPGPDEGLMERVQLRGVAEAINPLLNAARRHSSPAPSDARFHAASLASWWSMLTRSAAFASIRAAGSVLKSSTDQEIELCTSRHQLVRASVASSVAWETTPARSSIRRWWLMLPTCWSSARASVLTWHGPCR